MRAEPLPAPPASRTLVREADSVARTARPAAPPTCNVVFTRPDASPESLDVAPDIASIMSAGNDSPAPMPSSTVAGRMSAT